MKTIDLLPCSVFLVVATVGGAISTSISVGVAKCREDQRCPFTDALRYSFSLSSMFSRGFALGSDENDVVVIGGGLGGYVAMIKAAQLGSKLLVLRSVALLASTSVASLLRGIGFFILENTWHSFELGTRESEEICSRFDNLRFIKNSVIEDYLVFFYEIGNKEARAPM
ncbi:hypothetical protein L2E82_19515 [Cichorium intybus]|uniref:Uncharacterized protein n=1 Tax=Cichorium intybus TaxID=13427 RepID=A0ACB9FCU2_CICIN|nr:hypothetical protein L2E82_19515 [Cichorium intybus]